MLRVAFEEGSIETYSFMQQHEIAPLWVFGRELRGALLEGIEDSGHAPLCEKGFEGFEVGQSSIQLHQAAFHQKKRSGDGEVRGHVRRFGGVDAS